MSEPIIPDYIVVQVKNGSTYTSLCGVETASLNNTVTTTDRFVRDCAKPADFNRRIVRVNGKQWDLTASGVVNMEQFDLYEATLGVHAEFRLLYGRHDDALATGDERTGTIYLYRDGKGVMTAANENLGGDEPTAEFTIAGEGKLVTTEGAPA